MIIPVILSGGAGSRLWPLSTPEKPKQFQSLVSETMMITETALRVSNKAFFSAPIVIGSQSHESLLHNALQDYLPACTVLEPFGRNTAAAIAIAALLAYEIEPQTPLLILPSDHVIRNTDAFLQAVHLTSPLVDDGFIVTFGIEPIEPHIGYGYIEKGTQLADHPYASTIKTFVEKPDAKKAAAMLETGNFYWNSGIFMASAETLLDEFARFAPEVLAACRDTLAHSPEVENIVQLNAEYFEKVSNIAFDVAVLEKTQQAVVLPAAFDWSDVGSWAALHQIMQQENHENVIFGKNVQIENNVVNSFVRNDTTLPVFLSGVSNVIVVVTKEGVVVTSHDNAQQVKNAQKS
jgi:mannose-1-phosphate guanylyltransferase/mannose-6-phosphate isomerase